MLRERELELRVPRYVPFLAPKPEVIEDFHAAAKASAEAHKLWIAKEHAELAERRMRHQLRMLQGV